MELTLVATTPASVAEERAAEPATEAESPSPATRSHSPTLLTWTGVGVGVVGLVAGTVAGVMSMSKKSALQGECANDICGPSSYADYSAANSLATVSTVGFIAAGAGAVVATITLIVGHRSPGAGGAAPAAARTFQPSIGLGGAGLSGTF